MEEREVRRSRDRRWLRVAAAAEILEVSEHTLRRWADAGVVPCRRTPSGQRQFLPGDLAHFLEECEGGGYCDGRSGNGGNGRPAQRRQRPAPQRRQRPARTRRDRQHAPSLGSAGSSNWGVKSPALATRVRPSSSSPAAPRSSSA